MSTFASSTFAAGGPWLFGRSTDLAAFGGSALLAVSLALAGSALGWNEGAIPEWTWIAFVLTVDVAHVWATAFRVYLDGSEVRRRPTLYLGLPVLVWFAGVMAYAISPMTFWRVLAYVAVFHFVRQQYGWVALYRARAKEHDPVDRWIDTAAIYTATLYPLIHWHAHLPRRFVWFVRGDFVEGLAAPVASALEPVYWAILVAFVLRQLWLLRLGRKLNPGKILVVATTWLCWWLGIMALEGDFAFTVTNVLIHGIPYFVLTYRFGRARADENPRALLGRILRGGVFAFIAFVVLAAFLEEALWDRHIWHDRPWLFGEGGDAPTAALVFLVPLLSLPQALHYALDGFIWRRRQNPDLAAELGGTSG